MEPERSQLELVVDGLQAVANITKSFSESGVFPLLTPRRVLVAGGLSALIYVAYKKLKQAPEIGVVI